MAITNNPHASRVYSECEKLGVSMLTDFARTLAPLPLPDGWMINRFDPGSDYFGANVKAILQPSDSFDHTEKMVLRGHVAQFTAPGDKRIDIEATAELLFDFFYSVDSSFMPKVKTRFVMYTQIDPQGNFFYQDYPDRDTVILAMLAMGVENV